MRYYNTAKRTLISSILISFIFLTRLSAQDNSDYSKIDIMLIRGDYARVIDTCRTILAVDSLNSEIYYKLGLAYQNTLPDDKSFDCFLKAVKYSPGDAIYNFMVAKTYFNKGKIAQSKPIFQKLYSGDSLNWNYAYYLTSIYMKEGRYDESIDIYEIFRDKEPENYIFIDKSGFAYLRKKEFEKAIDLYNKSLAINDKNVSALKNLSYLYASTNRTDTAIQLLGTGIKIDSTDMDLYIRRAALNFSKDYTKRALDDYLVVLNSGDSTTLYLKRSGIGYKNNFEPDKAIKYLLLAYKKDSSDLETTQYLAQSYEKVKDLKSSVYYYNHMVKTLIPFVNMLSYSYVLLAETYNVNSKYDEAITAYLKSQEFHPNMSIDMSIANIYDEKLNDIPSAIYYYQHFLDQVGSGNTVFSPKYIESIEKRLEYLKEKEQEGKK